MFIVEVTTRTTVIVLFFNIAVRRNELNLWMKLTLAWWLLVTRVDSWCARVQCIRFVLLCTSVRKILYLPAIALHLCLYWTPAPERPDPVGLSTKSAPANQLPAKENTRCVDNVSVEKNNGKKTLKDLNERRGDRPRRRYFRGTPIHKRFLKKRLVSEHRNIIPVDVAVLPRSTSGCLHIELWLRLALQTTNKATK